MALPLFIFIFMSLLQCFFEIINALHLFGKRRPRALRNLWYDQGRLCICTVTIASFKELGALFDISTYIRPE